MLANDEDPLGNTVRICATATLRLGLIQVLLGAAGLVFGAINELKSTDKTMFDGFDGSEYILFAGSLTFVGGVIWTMAGMKPQIACLNFLTLLFGISSLMLSICGLCVCNMALIYKWRCTNCYLIIQTVSYLDSIISIAIIGLCYYRTASCVCYCCGIEWCGMRPPTFDYGSKFGNVLKKEKTSYELKTSKEEEHLARYQVLGNEENRRHPVAGQQEEASQVAPYRGAIG